MRSRVWGDLMDLALLGAAFALPRTSRGKLMATTAAVAGVTWLDVLSSHQLDDRPIPATITGTVRIQKAVTVNRSSEDLYTFWRDFDNLPTVMNHLESVRMIDEKRSHWVAKAPAGMTAEWDAEIVEDTHGQAIAWRSLGSADVTNSGQVRFERAAGGRGTVVKVELQYDPPAGRLGSLLAKLFGEEPGLQVQEGLRRFKQQMETGETATTDGQPSGRGRTAVS
jgi:uncharacterized membrane protein